MKRQFEIHDDSGCICSGHEIDVSQIWMFLTKPPEIVDKLTTNEQQEKIKKILAERKEAIKGKLKLLRVLQEHDYE